MMALPMSAPRRSTASEAAVVLALLAWSAGCSSSPNGPTGGAFAWDGAAVPEDAFAAEGGDGEAADADAPGDVLEAGAGGDGGPRCPESFTARAEGATCYTLLRGCDYPEGRCGCQICQAAPQGFGYIWSCRRWDSGGVSCPARSPAAGSPCDGPGLQCRYGAYCSISVGDDLQCLDGTWQPAAPLEACGYRVCPS
jgi:hypothetical protein